MAGDIAKQQIQDELKSAGLSRRGFIDRIKALGLGFGAAVALGIDGASASNAPETSLSVKSTNAALDGIINEGGKQEAQTPAGEKKVQEAWWYRRFWHYHRWYRRW